MAEDSEETGRTRQNLALYRKYRPATFAEVRGQDHVTQPLRQALRSGRINHAYLFSGPRGCGKTSSARILARSLNCVNGPTPDPCGVCDSCVALAPSGPGSIDVIEIDAASHGGVDDARDLRERAFYSPVSGRFKIYIIDEAHMVTQQGFNALLKLVEEPPPHLKFIFATTEPEKVIATIRSRTHHYPFRLMAPSVMRELTEEILNSEGVKFDPAVLPLVVRAGAGSARDTLSILDQLLAGSDDSGIRYDRAVALLGYTDATLLDEIVDAFAAGDGAAVFRAVNQVIEGGHEPRRFATDMLDRFRDLIVLASVPDAITSGLLDVPPDRAEALTAQASRSGLAALTRAAEIISAGLDQMRGATSPRLLLELMCAQVLLPAAATDERSVLARLERLESGAVNQSYPERTRPAPEPSVTPEPGRPVSAAPAQPAAESEPGRPVSAAPAQPAAESEPGRPVGTAPSRSAAAPQPARPVEDPPARPAAAAPPAPWRPGARRLGAAVGGPVALSGGPPGVRRCRRSRRLRRPRVVATRRSSARWPARSGHGGDAPAGVGRRARGPEGQAAGRLDAAQQRQRRLARRRGAHPQVPQAGRRQGLPEQRVRGSAQAGAAGAVRGERRGPGRLRGRLAARRAASPGTRAGTAGARAARGPARGRPSRGGARRGGSVLGPAARGVQAGRGRAAVGACPAGGRSGAPGRRHGPVRDI